MTQEKKNKILMAISAIVEAVIFYLLADYFAE